jgi:hypothetical protein
MGHGLDENAIEAASKWRFRPGANDGKPVTVAATFEVNFRLLREPLPEELAQQSAAYLQKRLGVWQAEGAQGELGQPTAHRVATDEHGAAYGEVLTYQVHGSGSLGLTATAGRFIVDGAGHVNASVTQSVNGSPSRRQGGGTYTVNADCSGTLTYTDSVSHSTSNYDIYINANNVQFVSTDNGTISAGTFPGSFRAFPGSVIELAPPCAALPSPAA